MSKPRLLRITTVPISLKLLLKGQLRLMMDQGFEVLAVSSDGPEVESLRRDGVAHCVVRMTRTISPLRDLVALLKLIRVIRKFRPDIVHTHTPKAGLLGMLAAWICRVPVRMHTVAGLPLMERRGFVRSVLIATEKITYACATGVYPNSRGLMKFIQTRVRTKTRLQVIGHGSSNGIDTSFFSPDAALKARAAELRRDHGVPDDAIVFVFVGRVVRDKGVNELVQAFAGMPSEIHRHLFVVGPFEDELDPISETAREIIRTNNNITLLGFQDDVRPVLLAGDVFVFPSYREGFPNVVMQACCMGIPCIVSDINGCNEIISHNETGLVVKPKDVDGLRSAMEMLATRSDLRETFASSAREFVVAHYDQEYVWNEILKEYENAFKACPDYASLHRDKP